MTVPHNPNQNQLLASVPPAEFRRISPHLELVPMPVGESYYESGGKLQHVYFPTSSIVSLRYVMENGAHAEIAGVGNEGMLGISVFMGDKALPRQALVRTVGFGYRLKARLLLEEFNRAETLQNLLIRYTMDLITRATQTVVCNRYHSVEQKICRWLLLNFDHTSLSQPVVTQDLLASALGIRPETLSGALKKMRQAELISFHCGQIIVPNRSYLENQTCECYSTIKIKLCSKMESNFSKPMTETVRAWPKTNNTIAPRALFGAS